MPVGEIKTEIKAVIPAGFQKTPPVPEEFLSDATMQTLLRALRASMPFVRTGTVTIELNFNEGVCANANVGFRTRQVLGN